MRAIRVTLTLFLISMIVSCSQSSKPQLTHGVSQIEERSAFWVGINGRIKFLLSFDSAEVKNHNENWEGQEFNIFYLLNSEQSEKKIMIYGDVMQGIISAAYNDTPLNLEQGMYLADLNGEIVEMPAPERYEFFDNIDVSVSSIMSAENANASSELQDMITEDMQNTNQPKKHLNDQGSPLGEEVDEVDAIQQQYSPVQ